MTRFWPVKRTAITGDARVTRTRKTAHATDRRNTDAWADESGSLTVPRPVEHAADFGADNETRGRTGAFRWGQRGLHVKLSRECWTNGLYGV